MSNVSSIKKFDLNFFLLFIIIIKMTTNNQLVILDKTSYINNKNVSNVFNILWQKYWFEYWDLHFQAVNVINNSYNHINEILSYIYKLKDGDNKKYTLRNYHEYNII